MPAVVRVGERIFSDYWEPSGLEQQPPEMLNTIRVPKNLLYLTERLPKPTYDQRTSKLENRRSQLEKPIRYSHQQKSLPKDETKNSITQKQRDHS